ncbi:MAG: sugar phosphate isomerase/epimerase [Dysgonamonadaceae bacterium]|jgi:sugar phosphate isomerase/epimerase|nr:sugar phosphate isomerase/epimerase [Dysgonamonadaceae bacterium]
MNRRNFIQRSAVTVAAACCGLKGAARPAAFMPAAKDGRRIGIQLYSIHETLPADHAGCLKKLSDIGYSRAEAYGFDGSLFLKKRLTEWSAMLADVGMKLSGTHCGTGILPADVQAAEWDYWRKSVDEMNAAGGRRLIQSFLPGDKTADGVKRTAEQFNRIGELCKAGGVKFGYHNHHSEFQPVDGQIVFDLLLRNTDPELVFFQMDLGHVLNGGGDILAYMRNFPGRFLSWHASDFKKGQGYAETGQGDVPYDALFAMADSCGLEDLTVEQETGGDIFASCRRDFDFLTKYPWTKQN